MNLKEELQREHSKANTVKVSELIGNDPEKFRNLMTLFFGDDFRITQRAAWVLTYCHHNHPELITPYLTQLLNNLRKPVSVAVKRNTFRVLQDVDLPEKLKGKAAAICFNTLQDLKEPVAVRVFAMTVLYNITLSEPELANELLLIIRDHLPHGSAAFKSRGMKILRGLEKLTGS